MSWWVVFLLWLLLLLLALGLVALVGLRVFAKFRALLAEIGGAAERLTAVAEGRSPGPDAEEATWRRRSAT